ncbi:MAG: hypothetical protein EZS28_023643 [Streblomastix strix]|uniref:Uncharacterized protein n=1 Tax=Streblomastix strix TaxID=222440 RepID=A0A5J4VE81_9EUKA|nr:MAG: hypothetical protein EZS28_023643 [Streblomastix strix]
MRQTVPMDIGPVAVKLCAAQLHYSPGRIIMSFVCLASFKFGYTSTSPQSAIVRHTCLLGQSTCLNVWCGGTSACLVTSGAGKSWSRISVRLRNFLIACKHVKFISVLVRLSIKGPQRQHIQLNIFLKGDGQLNAASRPSDPFGNLKIKGESKSLRWRCTIIISERR